MSPHGNSLFPEDYVAGIHGDDPSHLALNVPKSYTSPVSVPFQAEQGLQVSRLLTHHLANLSSQPHQRHYQPEK